MRNHRFSCGIEKAAYERDAAALDRAVRFDLTLHAYMLTQSGIPVITAGTRSGRRMITPIMRIRKKGRIPVICTGAASAGTRQSFAIHREPFRRKSLTA